MATGHTFHPLFITLCCFGRPAFGLLAPAGERLPEDPNSVCL
jgi:hypothetical protein